MMSDKKKEKKMPLGEAFRLTARGYRVWWCEQPQMMVSAFAISLMQESRRYVALYLAARLIDEIAGTRNAQTMFILVAVTLGSSVVLTLLQDIFQHWRDRHFEMMGHRRQIIYADKLLSMDFPTLDNPHTHDLFAQIMQNENWYGGGFGRLYWSSRYISQSIIGIIGAVALSVTLFTQQVPEAAGWLTALNNPVFIAGILLVLLLVTLVPPILSTKADAYWRRNAEKAKKNHRYYQFFEKLGHDRTRAADARMYRQEKIYDDILNSEENQRFRFGSKSQNAKDARGAMGLLQAASSAISMTLLGAVYLFVCLKAWGGAFGVGAITQYIGAITAISAAIGTLMIHYGLLRNNAPFLKELFAFMDIPNEMDKGRLPVEGTSGHHEIEFHDVSFRYPGRMGEQRSEVCSATSPEQEAYALRHVSLRFTCGERLAVVGMNGSGKTTLIKLLCRLYDPTEGVITLNGIDIREYDYPSYMAIFTPLFQDFKLFAYTLGQNVAGGADYDVARVEACLQAAGFGDRLVEWKNGLDTYLYKNFDDHGVEISGGEAQKIALARALYKDASFIVLDEPTASLDPVAEFEVYSRMNEIVSGKTAVFISHRLSSCRFCHDIAVFHEGKLVQRGGHDELLADESGKYYELWRAQAQYYESDAS